MSDQTTIPSTALDAPTSHTYPASRAQMSIVIVGHVDHGKSTIVGRLLADTGSLPEGKLEAVRQSCERNSKPFEYAFLIDALKDEQSQGITIDSARVFFNTKLRDYIIIDAPGHIEFLKNMVTGASRAEVAFLVIDAEEGIQENSRRHGYLLSMLGVRQLCVIVNKMDLIEYDHKTFRRIVRRYRRFLKNLDMDAEAVDFIPASGMLGDNIATKSEKMPWYEGQSVVQRLDEFTKEAPPHALPFRMPVQDVYKFTRYGDSRRIVAGTVNTGRLGVGDKVVFYPSGKQSTVATFEAFNAEPIHEALAPMATSFTLTEQIYVTRGQVACRAADPPPLVGSRVRVNLFWLGRNPMGPEKEYIFKMGAQRIPAHLSEITRVINASSLKAQRKKGEIEQHDVAEIILDLDADIAFDPVEKIPYSSRFVIVDEYEISGGGIVRGLVTDEHSWLRDNVMLRNFKWQRSHISPSVRAERYNQRSTLIVLTGPTGSGKSAVAKALEERLFVEGKLVYLLGIGNVVHGVSSDLDEGPRSREEHIRRLAEVAHLFLDAGIILIITADDLRESDLDLIRVPVNPADIVTVWIGDEVNGALHPELTLPSEANAPDAVTSIRSILRRRGAIFSVG